MALAYRGTPTTGTVHSGTSIVLTKPTGVVSGDALIIFVVGTATPSAPPSGFTQQQSSGAVGSVLYTKTAGGSEPGTYTLSWSSSQIGVAVCVAVSGQAVAWQDPAAFPAIYDPGSTGSCVVPSITLAGGSDWLLGIFAFGQSSAPGTLALPAGFTSQVAQFSSGGAASDMAMIAGDIEPTGSGATGAKTATSTTTNYPVGFLVGIAPLSGTIGGGAALAGAGHVTAAGTVPGAATTPIWSVGVDWNNNGSFADAGDDISKQVLDTSTMTIQYGRDQARAMNPAVAASAGFLIDNATRNYSPDYTGSTLTPNVLPGRGVLVSAIQSGTTYTVYRGYLGTYDVSSQDHVVTVSCADVLARFASLTLSTQLYFSVTTGQAIGFILDALGWAGGRDLDAGATMIRWWWEEGTDGLTALQKVVDSEGPPALVYLDEPTGNFCFRDRSHRLIRAMSKTSQSTWADSGTDAVPVFGPPFTYDLGWQGIINSANIPVTDRDTNGALSVVWQDAAAGTYTLAAFGAMSLTAQGSDPFTNALTPGVSTGDWVQQAGTTTAALSRASGQSTTITYTDGGTGSVISALQLQAYSVPVTHTTQVTASDPTSIGQYGTRSLDAVSRNPVWAGLNDAQAIAGMILAQRAKRLPVVQVTFAGGGNTLVLTQQLARNLSDRVTITEYETGLTSVDFFIEQVGHSISAGGAWLVTTFGCEKAPVTGNPFLFDDATWGRFDTGGGFGT